MSDLAFIQSSEIAFDAPLTGLRPMATGRPGGVVRGEQDAPFSMEHAAAETKAVVNGNAILSFVSDVAPDERADVLYSTQFAQRAATAKHDRLVAAEQWYNQYLEVLERLGWVGEGMTITRRTSEQEELEIDKVALDLLMDVATGNQLALLVKVFDRLKTLNEGSRALRIFELQSMANRNGNFQLGAVQRANGALAMALGAFHFRVSDFRSGFVFIKWGAQEMEFWAGVDKLSFNRDHYAPMRETVIRKLGVEAADYIEGLDLA